MIASGSAAGRACGVEYTYQVHRSRKTSMIVKGRGKYSSFPCFFFIMVAYQMFHGRYWTRKTLA